MNTRQPLTGKKLRTCQTMHFCCVCLQFIKYGQKYYDAGFWRRAHDMCADLVDLGVEIEHSREAQERAKEMAWNERHGVPPKPQRLPETHDPQGKEWHIENDWGLSFYFRGERTGTGSCEPTAAKLAEYCRALARAATEAAETLEVNHG